MPKRNELSLEKLLHERGISKTIKRSCRSVQYAMQRVAMIGSRVNRPKTGRKQITTERDGQKILRESSKSRRKASSHLTAELLQGFNRTISARIIRRRLQEAGLRRCKARKKL
ncbi:hypothetical protein Trydic_g16783 [Trypoxylus dichotomus]